MTQNRINWQEITHLPARATEVSEAGHVAAKVGTGGGLADAARRILEERIDLNFLVELGGLDLHEGRFDGLEVAALVAERHATRTLKSRRERNYRR